MSVYGLATAITVLKIGRFIFGQGYCDKKECPDRGHPYELRKFLGRIPYIGDLFYCPPCVAFWVGVIVSAKVVSPAMAVCPVWWQAMILDGLMACGVTWILFLFTKKLERGLDL
jgi:hypothetical protein